MAEPRGVPHGPNHTEYLSHKTRPDGLPFFLKADDGVHVFPGEIFCRYDDGDETMCNIKSPFSNTGNLRKHLRTHNGVKAVPTIAGKLSNSTIRLAEKEFGLMMAAVKKHGETGEIVGPRDEGVDEEGEGSAAAAVDKTTNPIPKKTRAPKQPSAKIPIPFTSAGKPSIAKMKEIVGLERNHETCGPCKLKRTKCWKLQDVCLYYGRFEDPEDPADDADE